MGKEKPKFRFNKKKELENLKHALNDPGMKKVERKLSAGEFAGRLIRSHSRRVGKKMKKGMTADMAVEAFATD